VYPRAPHRVRVRDHAGWSAIDGANCVPASGLETRTYGVMLDHRELIPTIWCDAVEKLVRGATHQRDAHAPDRSLFQGLRKIRRDHGGRIEQWCAVLEPDVQAGTLQFDLEADGARAAAIAVYHDVGYRLVDPQRQIGADRVIDAKGIERSFEEIARLRETVQVCR